MKKIIFILFLFLPALIFSQDADHGTKLGIQMSSDSFFGVLMYSEKFELSLKGQLKVYDLPEGSVSQDLAVVGLHAGYLFNLKDNRTDISAGFDLRSGIGLGDIDYVQYWHIRPRLACNYRLGEHFLLSGMLYPFHVYSYETDAENSYYLEATLPETAVAVSYLF